MRLIDLGYKILVFDSAAIPYFLEKFDFSEIEEFAVHGKIYVLGQSVGEFKNIIEKSGGDLIKINDSLKEEKDITSKVRQKKHKIIEWDKILSIDPKKVKENVLYIKHINSDVITDLPTFFDMSYSEYIRKKDCFLRLIAHGMENCPHDCVYCYANYSFDVPTTVIINFKDKLKKNFQKKEFKYLIENGFPINIGSITDPFSHTAIYFNLVDDFLSMIQDNNALIVTKSILFSQEKFLDILKKKKNVKLTFTYTGLFNYERKLPFNNSKFPKEAISQAIECGIDVNIFFRPIIENINDEDKFMYSIFDEMCDAGIKNICVGFLRNNFRINESLYKRFSESFKKISQNLTDKYMDDLYPPLTYRFNKLLAIHNYLYHKNMNISTCQPYVGKFRDIIETTSCSCRKERWQK